MSALRIVLLGDSHLARVVHGLQRCAPTPDDEVVNAAFGGAVAVDVVPQALGVPVVADDVVVLSVGTNDSMPHRDVPAERFDADVTRILDQVPARRWVYVVPPLGPAQGRSAADAVLAHGGVVVDTPSVLAPLGGDAFLEDDLHLTDAAYDVLLPAIAAAVAQVT